MGNGTKVALVALLILMVVVVAKFVKDDTEIAQGEGQLKGAPGDPKGKVANRANPPKKGPAAANKTQGGAKLATQKRTAKTQRPPPRPGNDRSREQLTRMRQGTRPPARSEGNMTSVLPDARPRNSLMYNDPGRNLKPRGSAGGRFRSMDGGDPSRAAKEPKSLVETQHPFDKKVATETGAGGTGAARLPSAKEPEDRSPEPRRRPGQPPVSINKEDEIAKEDRGKEKERETLGDSKNRLTSPNVARALRKPGEEETPGVTKFEPDRSKIDDPKPEPGKKSTSETRSSRYSFPMTHEIVDGDSPWALASRFYGSGLLHPLIQNANPGVKFRPGKKITIPAPPPDALKPTLAKAPPPPSGSATAKGATTNRPNGTTRTNRGLRPTSRGYSLYKVRKGDTLSGLAQRFYRKPSKFYLIEDANPDLKYTYLREGMEIKIPDAK